MSNSLIIKCSNQEAIDNNFLSNANGDWTTTIQEKIMIEDGDSIICRNAFIDTRSTNSQKIIIEEPLTLELDFIKYLVNWRDGVNTVEPLGTTPLETYNVNVDTVNSRIIPYNATQNDNVAKNDCRKYVSCSKTTTTAGFKYIANISYTGIDIFNQSGGFSVYVRYYDLNGDDINTKINIPPTDNGLGPFSAPAHITYDSTKTGADAPSNNNGKAIAVFLAGPDGFGGAINFAYGEIDGNNRVVIPNGVAGLGRTKIPALEGTGQLVEGATYTPIIDTVSIDLAKGNYDPADLVEEMNRKLQKITGTTSENDLSGTNQFLVQVGGVGADDPNNNFIEIGEGINQELYGFQINTALPTATKDFRQFIGANQVSLGYNEATEEFFWEFAHFPLYTSSNMEGIELVNFLDDPRNPNAVPVAPLPVNNSATIVNKFSGILFSGLRSFVKGTNIQTRFWDNVLGFDINLFNKDGSISPTTILTSWEVRKNDNDGDAFNVNGADSSVPVFLTTLVDGVNMVGAYKGIDAVVDKTSGGDKAYRPAFKALAPFPAGSGFNISQTVSISQPIDSDKTTPIESVNSILASKKKLDFGYFLVEVKAQFNNNFISPDSNKKDIVAIVSRYYELGAFTSSAQSDSVVYTHKGEPVILTSFRCRILNSSVIPAINLGADNTVFLEIVKGQKPQIEQKKK